MQPRKGSVSSFVDEQMDLSLTEEILFLNFHRGLFCYNSWSSAYFILNFATHVREKSAKTGITGCFVNDCDVFFCQFRLCCPSQDISLIAS